MSTPVYCMYVLYAIWCDIPPSPSLPKHTPLSLFLISLGWEENGLCVCVLWVWVWVWVCWYDGLCCTRYYCIILPSFFVFATCRECCCCCCYLLFTLITLVVLASSSAQLSSDYVPYVATSHHITPQHWHPSAPVSVLARSTPHTVYCTVLWCRGLIHSVVVESTHTFVPTSTPVSVSARSILHILYIYCTVLWCRVVAWFHSVVVESTHTFVWVQQNTNVCCLLFAVVVCCCCLLLLFAVGCYLLVVIVGFTQIKHYCSKYVLPVSSNINHNNNMCWIIVAKKMS